MNTSYRLKTVLLLLVGGPLFFLLLIEMLVAYGIGLHVTNQVFDRWLLDSAYSLAQEVRRESDGELVFHADEAAIEVFEWDELDDVYFRVATLDGRVLGGRTDPWVTTDIAELQQGPVFTNLELGGQWVRNVTVLANREIPEDRAIVSVAETLHKRIPSAQTLIVEVLLSKLALFVVALLVVSFALSRGIQPLVKLSQELASRSSRDLTPIETPAAPEEFRTLTDNTNRLLERLDTAFSTREQFIGNIAHQLKTPLAGIKLQAQLALRDQDIHSVHRALERICQTTDAMTHLNGQLLKLARAEAASGRGLKMEPVALHSVVDEVVENLQGLAASRNVKVRREFAGYTFEVLGEALLLRELAWNLVENAILYVQPGGYVRVSLARDNGEVVFTVKDNGAGISREHWPQIFDRFFRPTAEGEGCGLGLAIVHEIALAHRATVELREAPDCSGACFVTRFPVSG
ncbi:MULTISPECIES: sensor histidine kinase [Microbulbifer]|uniref:histidine kinase n=1 Tax=Microbulbifer celer TaxID=435905 RepID=A0ABW3UA03_9GAMM|nr:MULTISPECIES: sensor histidine kinase [Microbulbifer]UFN58788.1 sensor histidine kinase [Microbulbifer celer]